VNPWVARADSGFLFPDHGERWCAIGDAAMATDPLAGDGVVRAIRSALGAAARIEQALGGAGTPHVAKADGARRRFIDYLGVRERYYSSEQRFAEGLYWRRRHPIAWREAPLFLDPRHSLRWDGAPLSRDAIAPHEALLPVHAVRALLEHLRQATPAHQALEFLRATAPLEERRLLVAVQDLIARGIVTSTHSAQGLPDAGSLASAG
jgi:hypothetical protein